MDKHDKILSLLAKPYTLSSGVFFCTREVPASNSAGKGLAASLQAFLKRFPRLYRFLVELFSPVLVSRAMRRALESALLQYGPDRNIVNLGCGPLPLPGRPDIINVDITPFDCVDICADATDLPFADASVDFIYNMAMLEHVPDPAGVLAELKRVLKPGGKVLLYIPFMQPEHAAPSDYTRWTQHGIKQLASGFTINQSGIGAGPTSAWLWLTIKFLSVLLSFGNKTLQDTLYLFLMPLLFPIKFLDSCLENTPGSASIASAFFILGTKDSQS